MSRVLRLTFKQNYQGHTAYNVFHYSVDNNEDDNASYLTNRFDQVNTPAIVAVQNVGVVSESLYAIDVLHPPDFDTLATTDPGVVGSVATGMPRFNAHSMVFNVTPSEIRHGFKRFTGVDESQVATGVYTTTAQTALDDLATALCASLTISGRVFIPIVVRYTGFDPVTIAFYTEIIQRLACYVSTQNTRKR